MPRFKLILEYDGRPFYGWQTQKEKNGVQDAVEAAFGRLFINQNVKTYCSGRTDRGVHACGQVIHCDIDTDMSPKKLCEAMNYYIKPRPISFLSAEIVPDIFHARFHAIQRKYCYKILNRRAMPTFREGLLWHIPGRLSLEDMKISAQDFLGTHDFTTFRSVDCQSPSAIRTIDKVYFELYRDEIHFCVEAKSFLQHQIRSMVGSLVKIGLGKYPIDFIEKSLITMDRKKCGPVAPPYGLYFENTVYNYTL